MIELKSEMDICDVQKSIMLLNTTQLKLFFTFGLRQTKWFFEKDYPNALRLVPEGSLIEGINDFGRIQAKNETDKKRYGYFNHNQTWSQSNEYIGGGKIIQLDDLKKLFECFNLKDYTLDALTHVPEQFKSFHLQMSALPS